MFKVETEDMLDRENMIEINNMVKKATYICVILDTFFLF